MTTDPGWQKFTKQMAASAHTNAKLRLLQLMLAHAITMQPVERTDRVAGDLPWTWERMEHEGFCSLTTESKQSGHVVAPPGCDPAIASATCLALQSMYNRHYQSIYLSVMAAQ